MRKLVLLALLFTAGCNGCSQNIPPNLSPQAVAAYQGTKVIVALDAIRDVSIALADTNPPVIRRDVTTAIVAWHKSAITTIHATPTGWKMTVLTGLDQVKSNLNQQEQTQLGPYFSLAKILINEVSN